MLIFIANSFDPNCRYPNQALYLPEVVVDSLRQQNRHRHKLLRQIAKTTRQE
jgi:hypothetical protein